MVASVVPMVPRGLVVVTALMVFKAVPFAAIAVHGERRAVLGVTAELGRLTVVAMVAVGAGKKTAAIRQPVWNRPGTGVKQRRMVAVRAALPV
jgi:hypothetical protein